MSALFLLAVIAWSIVPYKAWSRGLLGGEGFNLGDAILLLVLVSVALRGEVWWKRTPLSPWIAGVWVLVAVACGRGLLEGESVREMGRVLRGAAFWGLVPLMLLSVTTRPRLTRWVLGMNAILIAAAVTIPAFSFFPALIPAGDEVGLFRDESVGGFERVFTHGMWGVYAGSIMTLSALLLRRGGKWSAVVLLSLLLLCLSFTFARTFFAGILVAAATLAFFARSKAMRSAVAGTFIIVLVFSLGGVPSLFVRLGGAVSERMMLFVSEAPEYAFQTFFWRLSEFEYLAEAMPSFTDRALGVLGRVYTLPGGYTASMPHIGYLGIYYGHGLIGALAYGAFLAVLTVRLLNNARRLRGGDLHWVTAGAFATWIALLAAGLSAPLFQYAWGVASLAFTVGLSESAVSISQIEHAPTSLLYRHTVSERGDVHPGDG